MYRNNVNINDLINRFEVTNDDDFDVPENIKYVGSQSFVRKYNRRQSEDDFGSDASKSLVKAYNNSKFFDNTVFVRRTNVSMSGAKEFIKQLLLRISALLEMISKFPFPRMSVMSFGLTSLLAVFLAPRGFTEKVLYPAFKILFTIIYPAYRSFKAVRNKNLKEYLKWLVFWIVYAFFICFELVSDALLHWFPFYYEIKVIFLIWMLGPSSRGSMKIYKNIIHPALISREQEIDEIIQLAQDHGYMQVFRLSSKSVNYANKIIMQDAKTDSSFIVSHQLMKNISLSSISDAGTNDNDDMLHMRRYSIEKMPIYASNYPYENIEARRRPSFDYKYDDMMSSGYSSPTMIYQQRFPLKHQQGAFIEENPKLDQNFQPTDTKSQPQSPTKASINNLTEDEIILAYHKLQLAKNIEKATEAKEEESSQSQKDENYQEFLKWKSRQKETQKVTEKNSNNENSLVDVQKPNVSGHFDFVMSEVDTNNEVKLDADEFFDVKSSSIEVMAENMQESQKIYEKSVQSEEIGADKTESDQEIDFNEFKDVNSEDDVVESYLKVPLVIQEENEIEIKPEISTIITQIDSDDTKPPVSIDQPTASPSEPTTVNATLTITNDPLQIITNLSTSTISLASSSDGSENKFKRPAKHSKGRAPQPPAVASTSNVIEGYFYDELMKKHFKETEL